MNQVVFQVFDIFWCAAFLLELALRVIADGSHFLDTRNPEPLGAAVRRCGDGQLSQQPWRAQVHVERHRCISGGTLAAA